jgi:DNA repair exonuclease SbcCD ATPase subunit
VRLLRLRADGFGPLRGEYVFQRGRITLVVDRNETGKSSLIAAIAAALYGLEADRRSHKVLTPLERWRPWDNGSYRVELDVESEGETWTIKRDFGRGTVEVWDERGLEVTATFREGKDSFPVGKRLLGLDDEEFEKCALVRQGELEQVVSADERARRTGTLQARLETAADTRGGDTSAAEAVQVLQAALRRYDALELEFTGTIETAISRLELQRGNLAVEWNTLEHDRARAAEPLAELARLGAEEQAAREAVAALEHERRAHAAGDLARRLAEHRERATAVRALECEAGALRPFAGVPANAEAELRETLAERDAAQRNLEALETRRAEDQERRRADLEGERAALTSYEGCTEADADRLLALAADLRRLAGEDEGLRHKLAGLREGLDARGVEPGRVQELAARLGGLVPAEEALLGGQDEVALQYQRDIADLEQARAAHTEVLRQVDALRAGRKTPGWILAAIGVGAAVAGGVVLGIHGEPRIGMGLLAGGLVVGLAGVALVAMGEGARRAPREQALRGLAEAQGRINTLKAMRAEGDVRLEEIAVRLGLRGAVELLREWKEYKAALAAGTSPLQDTQERVDALDARRDALLVEVRTLLERSGGGAPEPAHLERVAAGIRHRLAVDQSLAELERSWSWMPDEKRIGQAALDGLQERAQRLLQAAGLAYEPARPWLEQVQELAERSRQCARLATLEQELLPQARARLAPEAEVADLEAQLAALEAECGGPIDPEATPRPVLEVERESRRQRELIETLQRKRADLRVTVEESLRRLAAREPELLAERARIERALERARRFKAAAERAMATIQQVALETHRRWADFLNRRVGELLAAMGAGVDQVRFGEDLDFSLRRSDGQQVARGKALLQLSAGARDQLHLAVRLAIAEFLSKPGNPLPLLMDDVFANCDDERARAGMRLLAGTLAQTHQVIVMTCHRHRHEHLASLDPDVWAAGVQWMELKATAAQAH